VEASESLDARVLVRWFDNNSFFRAPAVSGPPRLSGPLPDWVTEDAGGPRVATLPSPFLFSRAAQGGSDPDELMVALARDVLAPAAGALVGSGVEALHLEEPWLAYFGIEDPSWEPLESALGSVREAAAGVPLVLHVYYGDAAPHADRLRSLPVDALGVDFAETSLGSLPTPWGTGLAVGAIDGRRSVLESPEGTAAFVRAAAERLGPTRLIVTSGSDLELLPAEVARRKVRLLGEVAGLARKELS
jgi:5-methyltetrahydropteroyltriglutamate--homocysteine methyltransferase